MTPLFIPDLPKPIPDLVRMCRQLSPHICKATERGDMDSATRLMVGRALNRGDIVTLAGDPKKYVVNTGIAAPGTAVIGNLGFPAG